MSTIKVNGVETVSVCTGEEEAKNYQVKDYRVVDSYKEIADALSLGYQVQGKENIQRPSGTSVGFASTNAAQISRTHASVHDQPETTGTPIWIWSTSTNALLGEHAFEDFRGAKYCHEIRVPTGWSLVSRRRGGTFLRSTFGVEVSALDAIASAMDLMNRPHPFLLVATTER